MAFSKEGAGRGAVTGGTLTLGSGNPFAIAGGAIAGGLIGGFFGGGKKRQAQNVDISGELARIRGIFDQLRSQAKASAVRTGKQQRKQLASNLAARGTLRSAVSEHGFGRVREDTSRNIAAGEAALFGQQARTESGLLGTLLGLREKQRAQAAAMSQQNRAQLMGLAGAGLSGILGSGQRGASLGAGGFFSSFGFGNRPGLAANQRFRNPGFSAGAGSSNLVRDSSRSAFDFERLQGIDRFLSNPSTGK